MTLWRRKTGKRRSGFLDEPSAIDPLKSKADAETFGVGYGVGKGLGTDPIITGAAALYAKAEQEAREAEEAARRPHASGKPAGRPAGKRAGER